MYFFAYGSPSYVPEQLEQLEEKTHDASSIQITIFVCDFSNRLISFQHRHELGAASTKSSNERRQSQSRLFKTEKLKEQRKISRRDFHCKFSV